MNCFPKIAIILYFSACTQILSACTQKSDMERTSPEVSSEKNLVNRGKEIYMSNCIACHNVDPHKDGALGPSVSESSFELIQFRVLRAQYPEGYKAKRQSSQMIALPHLEKEIPALHAYLNAK